MSQAWPGAGAGAAVVVVALVVEDSHFAVHTGAVAIVVEDVVLRPTRLPRILPGCWKNGRNEKR